MTAKEPLDGLGFDKMVFDRLMKDSDNGDRRSHMNVAEAEDSVGLSQGQILRAISAIRAKGYPVISISTRRTWENDFRIPTSQREYVEWRSKMIDDLKTLQQILIASDAAAKAKFGDDMPVQAFLF